MAFGSFGNGGVVSTSAFKVPTGRPQRSIIGQALAAHPSWRTPGAARPGAGVGSAGLAGLSTGPLTNAPQPPRAPTAPAPAAPSTPPGGSPLDATYYNNVAGNQFQTGNQINALNLRDSNNLTALQSALGNLAYQQPRDQLALEQKANAGGGLYSSVEDQGQSNLAHAYYGKQQAAQTTYDQAHSALASQIAALLGGEQTYATGQAIDSGNRAAAAAQANPASAASATVPSPAAGAPSGGGGGHGRSPLTAAQARAAQAQAEARSQQQRALAAQRQRRR